ncbi:MAG TPA: hypothetical protein VF556_17105, partial [Pyrinomonadaceae bacterium]
MRKSIPTKDFSYKASGVKVLFPEEQLQRRKRLQSTLDVLQPFSGKSFVSFFDMPTRLAVGLEAKKS